MKNNVQIEKIEKYINVILSVTKDRALALDEKDLPYSPIVLTKTITLHCLERFRLTISIKKFQKTITLKDEQITKLSIGIFCSTGFALLFAYLFILKIV